MKPLNLKSKLNNKQPTIGSWLTLSNSSIAEIFSNAGFDWVLVDLEHSVISISDAGELIKVIELSGSSPLVRPTSLDANLIKRIMDAGAHGIIAPMVNSVEDAVLAVSATRYEPAGIRGVGLGRAHGYGTKFDEYFEWQKKSSIVIVQIEHIKAFEDLENILSVDGVDGFIIGPYDLSCSMGIPGEFDNPEFTKVLEEILETGMKIGCPAGIHIVEPDIKKLEKALNDGYKFIGYSVDFRILDNVVREGIDLFKSLKK